MSAQPNRPAIHFDEASHTYTAAGQRVPGVTTVIRPLFDWSMVNADVLAAKSQLGRWVHSASELVDQDNLDDASVPEDAAGYVEAYRRWRREMSPLVLLSEQVVFHGLHNYAGTLDRVVQMGDDEWLLDLKTSAQIHRGAGVQTAAYEKALNFGKPLRRGVLQLKPDGSYRLKEFTDPRDWVTFQACLLIHRFQQESPHV